MKRIVRLMLVLAIVAAAMSVAASAVAVSDTTAVSICHVDGTSANFDGSWGFGNSGAHTVSITTNGNAVSGVWTPPVRPPFSGVLVDGCTVRMSFPDDPGVYLGTLVGVCEIQWSFKNSVQTDPNNFWTGDGCEMPLLTITVHKDIVGTPPGDQAFQVRVDCVHDDATVFGETQTISWDAQLGTFSPSDANAVFTPPTRVGGTSDDVTCTVGEIDTAGATSHTISCTEETAPAVCDSTTGAVTIPYDEAGAADITVTNNYLVTPTTPVVPAPAPTPVVAAARFTG